MASDSQSRVLEELVASATAGDRSAQDQLLSQYWPVIRSAVRGRKNRIGGALAAREQTVDLEQSTAIKVLRKLAGHEWRGSSAFAAWIRRLAETEVIDSIRHHRAARRDAKAETGEEHGDAAVFPRSAESMMDGQREFQELIDDVQSLKAEYAAALMMHHMGFSHAEIGEALDCTAEAARKLVSRGRTRLLAVRDERS